MKHQFIEPRWQKNSRKLTHLLDNLLHLAQSPDLNPIEQGWHELKKRVNSRTNISRNVEELCIALQDEWQKMDLFFINSLIESTPRCVEAVILARGGHTKY